MAGYENYTISKVIEVMEGRYGDGCLEIDETTGTPFFPYGMDGSCMEEKVKERSSFFKALVSSNLGAFFPDDAASIARRNDLLLQEGAEYCGEVFLPVEDELGYYILDPQDEGEPNEHWNEHWNDDGDLFLTTNSGYRFFLSGFSDLYQENCFPVTGGISADFVEKVLSRLSYVVSMFGQGISQEEVRRFRASILEYEKEMGKNLLIAFSVDKEFRAYEPDETLDPDEAYENERKAINDASFYFMGKYEGLPSQVALLKLLKMKNMEPIEIKPQMKNIPWNLYRMRILVHTSSSRSRRAPVRSAAKAGDDGGGDDPDGPGEPPGPRLTVPSLSTSPTLTTPQRNNSTLSRTPHPCSWCMERRWAA